MADSLMSAPLSSNFFAIDVVTRSVSTPTIEVVKAPVPFSSFNLISAPLDNSESVYSSETPAAAIKGV